MKHGNDTQAIYQQEAAEQLSLVEEIILELEANPRDRETLNRLFRVFHTIKGSGSMFGFEEIAAFTHHIETILDEVREDRRQFDKTLADLTLAAKDCISEMLVDPKRRPPEALNERVRLAAAACVPTGGQHGAHAPLPTGKPTASTHTGNGTPVTTTPLAAGHRFQIDFSLSEDVFMRGLNPVGLLHDLRGLGTCSIRPKIERIPVLEQLNPESCMLGWDITLETTATLNDVKDVFIFVEDDSRITIREEAPTAKVAAQPAATAGAAPVTPPPPTNVAAAEPQAAVATAAARTQANDPAVRVPSSRLDQLLSLVGELVINHSRLQQLGKRHELPELVSAVEDLERLVSGLRDHVLGIRMTPIGSTFSRFRRLVRDLSAELGKEVELETIGEETELDKNMLDQLGEPLVHLIRNSVDHGIAVPAAREAKGKPRTGRIRLSANHEGAHVIIRIEDDGDGLNCAAIRTRAIERGLIGAAEELSPEELHKLIFLPGFSTAQAITSVSGRGVGMDVVKRQIESLRGTVSLASTPGKGTTITLTLPLTLAIIEGLLVDVGGDCFILPLSVVDENVEILPGECATGNGRNLISVRDELVPFVRLRELFESGGHSPAIERVVIVRTHNQRMGFVVDRILGTHQTVVQSLGRFYHNTRHVSGATILGDGQVALILDVAGLTSEMERISRKPRSAA